MHKIIGFLFPRIIFSKDDFSQQDLNKIEEEEIESRDKKRITYIVFLFLAFFLFFGIFNLLVFHAADVETKYAILYCIHYVPSIFFSMFTILKLPQYRRFSSLFIIGSMGVFAFSIGFLLANSIENINSYKYVAIYYLSLSVEVLITILLYKLSYKKLAKPEMFTRSKPQSKSGVATIITIIICYSLAEILLDSLSLHTVGIIIIIFSTYFCYVEAYCLATALHFSQVQDIIEKGKIDNRQNG